MANHPLRRVLVVPPGDAASASSIVAISAGIADGLGAELLLLGVAPAAIPTTAGQGLAATGDRRDTLRREQARLDEAAQARLHSLVAAVPVEVSARTVLGRGRPGPAIVRAARQYEADLIVVGMRRSGRAAHLLHDGADRYVLQHSFVPVVVVPYDHASRNGAHAKAA
jgi:nucleotide-binding universal stress UspA family protein